MTENEAQNIVSRMVLELPGAFDEFSRINKEWFNKNGEYAHKKTAFPSARIMFRKLAKWANRKFS